MVRRQGVIQPALIQCLAISTYETWTDMSKIDFIHLLEHIYKGWTCIISVKLYMHHI